MRNTALSINVNKIALIRNSREGNNPDLASIAKRVLEAGADGITVHPRPDQRHIRPEDCAAISALVESEKKQRPSIEFNIEGNPAAGPCNTARSDFSDYPGFIQILEQYSPDQATLVPDNDRQLTSDHGFDLSGDTTELQRQIKDIQQLGCRVSLFMDPDPEQVKLAGELGADRIELYTGPFAKAFAANQNLCRKIFEAHCLAAETAHSVGLGVNAGHDLNLDNLQLYRQLPHLKEVSIGHAFTIDSLEFGLVDTVQRYLKALSP